MRTSAKPREWIGRLRRIVANSPRRAIVVLNVVICGFFLVGAMIAGLLPAATTTGLYGAPVPVFIAAAALSGSLFLLAGVPVSPRVRKAYPLIVAGALAVSLLVMCVVAYGLQSYGYTWDSEIVFNQAVTYALHGKISDSFVNYFVISPNNIALLAGLGGLFRLLNALGWPHFLTAAVGVNVLLLFLSEVLTFLVAKMLYGRRIALIALGFCFVFISMSMYVEIPYTDTLTIIFPILLLFIALNMVRTERAVVRVALSSAFGGVTFIGYSLKPTVVIAAIAIILTLVLSILIGRTKGNTRRNAGRPRTLIASACLVACGLGAVGALNGYRAYVDALEVIPYPVASANQNSYPLLHFIDIGMKYRVYNGIPYYGGYNDADARVVAALPTKSEKTAYSISQINSQLAAFGPIGYLVFLAHKSNWMLSDATFYAFGEGSNANVTFVHHDGVSQWLRDFMWIGGGRYILFSNILQVFWIAILLLIGVQVVVLLYARSSRQSLYLLMPRLMLAGIMLFLLFFEGRSRYLFLYLPIFIVTALYLLSWYSDLDSPVKRLKHDAAEA